MFEGVHSRCFVIVFVETGRSRVQPSPRSGGRRRSHIGLSTYASFLERDAARLAERPRARLEERHEDDFDGLMSGVTL